MRGGGITCAVQASVSGPIFTSRAGMARPWRDGGTWIRSISASCTTPAGQYWAWSRDNGWCERAAGGGTVRSEEASTRREMVYCSGRGRSSIREGTCRPGGSGRGRSVERRIGCQGRDCLRGVASFVATPRGKEMGNFETRRAGAGVSGIESVRRKEGKCGRSARGCWRSQRRTGEFLGGRGLKDHRGSRFVAEKWARKEGPRPRYEWVFLYWGLDHVTLGRAVRDWSKARARPGVRRGPSADT